MKKKYFLIGILAAGIVFISGCDMRKGRSDQSFVSVLGTGVVLVQPDVIQMTITLSNIAQTTKAAQEEVSKMLRQVLQILKEANIEDKNISTASLNFNSEYDYTSRRVLVGQKAEQRIIFSIENINTGDEKVSGVIDQLIQINGIELNQINFSVKDNTEYFSKSRELAFQKAVEKANQYAALSKLKVIKVLSVSEDGNQQVAPINNRLLNRQLNYDQEAANDFGSTIVPAGELEITTKISVTFLLG